VSAANALCIIETAGNISLGSHIDGRSSYILCAIALLGPFSIRRSVAVSVATVPVPEFVICVLPRTMLLSRVHAFECVVSFARIAGDVCF